MDDLFPRETFLKEKKSFGIVSQWLFDLNRSPRPLDLAYSSGSNLPISLSTIIIISMLGGRGRSSPGGRSIKEQKIVESSIFCQS